MEHKSPLDVEQEIFLNSIAIIQHISFFTIWNHCLHSIIALLCNLLVAPAIMHLMSHCNQNAEQIKTRSCSRLAVGDGEIAEVPSSRFPFKSVLLLLMNKCCCHTLVVYETNLA